MKVLKTTLESVKIIEPDILNDCRGFFYESYSAKKLIDFGIDEIFVQDNHSFSKIKNTLRGLHFQLNPYAQTKLIRCTRGKILDVAVDIQKDSPSYCRWVSVELSADNFRQLYIPAGFAHGYITLTDNTEVQYKTSGYYEPEYERTIRWNDMDIGIDWGIENPVLSERDSKAPFLKNSDNNFCWGRNR